MTLVQNAIFSKNSVMYGIGDRRFMNSIIVLQDTLRFDINYTRSIDDYYIMVIDNVAYICMSNDDFPKRYCYRFLAKMRDIILKTE